MKNGYSRLNDQMAHFIVKIGGLDRAIEFLDTILVPKNHSNKEITLFINFSVSMHLGIKESDLVELQSNAKYRNICYRLHKEFLNLSIRKTMVLYDKKENTVMLGLRRMEEIIKDPSLDPEIYDCYLKIKKQTQKFTKYISGENKDEEA